jgi:ABC-type nitrate/sulfonate/bicarbonate transport system substrate-binding protein
MRIFNRLTRTVAALFVGVAFAAGSGAQERRSISIVFPTTVTTFMIPYLIAQDQGWFKEHGLDVKEVYLTGDSNAARALVSGSGDVALLGMQTLFDLAQANAGLTTIVSWQPIVDYHIVVRKELGKDLKALVGKTLASGGPSDMTTEIPRMILKKHGLDQNSVKFVQIGGHGPRLQAVAGGKADATMINTLTALKGVKDGSVVIAQSVVKDFPNLGYGFVVVKAADLKDPAKRAAFLTLVEGSIIGARMVMKDPALGVSILHKRVPDMDRGLIEEVVKDLNATNVWGVDGGLQPDVVTFTSEVALALGMVKRPIKPEEVYDPSLVNEVLKKVGPNK